ncbi:tetratricopeptide repeat protein [Nocardia uniformis]|uniref:Tetratricopeptide repeat protein n=1 Tax=Nocardia uniformis TaxID=53432 RepID=A0A849BXH3_9NOCA|nr:tetratricopeptide repeat protein [Nocardia uniformis]NNH71232.1 tetratricopeptide repeat protein [Nocardia uniformis]
MKNSNQREISTQREVSTPPQYTFDGPDEFADALSLLVADAVWATTSCRMDPPTANLLAGLRQWREHPRVSTAAALVVDTATFAGPELELLRRALIRAARAAWRQDPDRSRLVRVLRDRAESEHSEDRSLEAADLLTAAVELCEIQLVSDRAETLPLLADLLRELVAALAEAGCAPTLEHEVVERGAAAARQRIEILDELVEFDRDRFLRPLAGAHMAAAGIVARADGPRAGLEHSACGVRLYEQMSGTGDPANLGRLLGAWSKHIALLDSDGDTCGVREWKRHRTERLRCLTGMLDGSVSSHEFVRLIRLLGEHGLHAEAEGVAAQAVSVAEDTAVDGDEDRLWERAQAVLRQGECLYRAGRRDDALRAWNRYLAGLTRLRDTCAGNATAVAAGCRSIVALATNLGDTAIALDFGARAVDEWLRLSGHDRGSYLVTLVDELCAQADRLGRAGRSAEASSTVEAAVAHARELALSDTVRHQRNLSWALTCATRIHLSSWRTADAELRSEQAVELLERLAELDPDADAAELADALNNRAVVLNRRADYTGARVFAVRAVAMYETLAADAVDYHEPLANTLCTFTITLCGVRAFDEALVCAERALAMYARLAERGPAIQLRNVAFALNRVASVHEELSNSIEVHGIATKVLEICGSPSADSSWDDQRAFALHLLVQILTCNEKPAAALAYSTSLLQIRERAAAADPAAGAVNLAVALGCHAVCLWSAGRPREAIEYAYRSLALWRVLAEGDPATHRERLTRALDRCATVLWTLGRTAESVEMSTEAVEQAERLLAEQRDRYLDTAAICLTNHAGRLDRTEEAIAMALRGLAMYRELVDRDAERYLPGLASLLDRHAQSCVAADEWAEAAEYAQSVEIAYEELTKWDSVRYRPEWAAAVEYSAYVCYGLAEWKQASIRVDRALAIRRDAVDEANEWNAMRLARSEGWAARFRLFLDEPELAGRNLRSSADHYRVLIEEGHDDLVPELADVYHQYAKALCENGYRSEAPAVMNEAMRWTVQLAVADRVTYRSCLAGALRTQSWLLASAGRRHLAVGSGRAALEVLNEMIGEGDEVERARLADYHDALADSLASVGCVGEAIAHNDCALALWEDLARESGEPSADLAWSLWHRARWRAAVEPTDPEVLMISRRAVEIYDGLWKSLSRNNEFRAGALVDHAVHLSRAGDGIGAGEYARRAVRLTEGAAERPLRHLPDLALICYSAAVALMRYEPQDAVVLADRSVRLFAELVECEPDAFGGRLSEAREMVRCLLEQILGGDV